MYCVNGVEILTNRAAVAIITEVAHMMMVIAITEKGEKKMARYIDVENIKLKGISVFDQNLEILIPLSDVRKSLQMTQTADVQEVRHAKFELVDNGKGICSNCHRLDSIDNLAKYCRYCGAKMDGKE